MSEIARTITMVEPGVTKQCNRCGVIKPSEERDRAFGERAEVAP